MSDTAVRILAISAPATPRNRPGALNAPAPAFTAATDPRAGRAVLAGLDTPKPAGNRRGADPGATNPVTPTGAATGAPEATAENTSPENTTPSPTATTTMRLRAHTIKQVSTIPTPSPSLITASTTIDPNATLHQAKRQRTYSPRPSYTRVNSPVSPGFTSALR